MNVARDLGDFNAAQNYLSVAHPHLLFSFVTVAVNHEAGAGHCVLFSKRASLVRH